MNIHLGSSNMRYAGFLNVDIVPGQQIDLVGSATNIPVPNNSVEILYFNAVLEHLFSAQVKIAFQELHRVLSPEGFIVGLGIPNFQMIARLYLQGAPGIEGPRFDLYNVYRYTHGLPDRADHNWFSWNPAEKPDTAPSGWMGQLHKTLFDANVLGLHLKQSGFSHTLFSYCYRGEPEPVNLGFIASKCPELGYVPPHGIAETIRRLVPGAEQTIDSIVNGSFGDLVPDQMLNL